MLWIEKSSKEDKYFSHCDLHVVVEEFLEIFLIQHACCFVFF